MLWSCANNNPLKNGACEGVNLQCEYLNNPLGIDVLSPRLSWELSSEAKGKSQSAYRIIVASNLELLNKNKGDLWDTKKVVSDQSINISYEGKALTSRQRCYWKVMAWDEKDGASEWSEAANWEMALLDENDWTATWIEAPQVYSWPQFKSDVHNIKRAAKRKTYDAAPYLRKEFKVEKEVVKARAYISGMGLYELSINGAKIGDHVLDPTYTNFDNRVHYVTYDVTAQLQQGENAVGVHLGNGWYNVDSRAVWGYNKAPWKDRPTCLLQLEMEYSDGTSSTVITDESWKAFPSPIVYTDIRQGEKYDATKESPNWNTTDFDDSDWAAVRTKSGPKGVLKAQMMPANKVMRELTPVSVKTPKAGVHIVDMGQNMAGWIQLKVKGKKGDVVKMKFGEILDEKGCLDQYNINRHHRETEFQVAEYTIKGDGEEVWEAKFTYFGFQYIEIEGYPGKLTTDDITGRVVHTSFDQAGAFSCSNETVNKITHATEWAFISNFLGYPTDCPQREKNGWTGDAHLSAETALLTFKPQSSYTKWLYDCQDAQSEEGILPGIVPTCGWGYALGDQPTGYGPAWDGAYIWVPWYMYLYSGDEEVLRTHYTNMKKSIAFMESNAKDNILDIGLGDWVFINTYAPSALTGTACYYDLTMKVSQIATILEKPNEAEQYASQAKAIKKAFNKTFYKANEKTYAGSEQTSLAAALYFDLVPTDDKKEVAATLADVIHKNDGLLDCGVLGAKWIPHALSDNGHADLFYQIATDKRYPGWGYWLEQGATTLWEDFNIKSLDNSRNHMFFGDIVHWFYKELAGIRPDEQNAGFKHFYIKPYYEKSLDFVTAEHDCLYGKIRSEWKKNENSVEMLVEIPANTTSTVVLPKGDVIINGKASNESKDIIESKIDEELQYFKFGSGVYSIQIN